MGGQLQIRYETKLSAGEHVGTEAWRHAGLEVCPNHPDGGCSLSRHGTCGRKIPAGTRVARWRCPESHTTFSLLPDCLATRTPEQVEEAVVVFETAPGVQAAARQARPGHHISDRGAERCRIRWRARSIHRFLAIVIGLFPDLFRGVAPEVGAFRARLGTESAPGELRGLCAGHLRHLPPPVGFRPPGSGPGSLPERERSNAGSGLSGAASRRGSRTGTPATSRP